MFVNHSLSRCKAHLLLLTLALVGFAGCSGSSVQGTVTLDGTPVNGGAIRFVPTDKNSGAKGGGGQIVDGKYVLKGRDAPPAGSYKVEINWKKPTGKKVPTPGDSEVQTDETAEAIPATYNTATTLKGDVTGGSTTLNFDLKSK
jgi:hypothetical protein